MPLESPRRGDSDEYTQNTIVLQKIKRKPLNYSLYLQIWHYDQHSTHMYQEQIYVVRKMVEPFNL